MNNTRIHPTAIIEEGAQIGAGVTIEAYAVIKPNVKLCDGVVVKSHAYIDGHTTIGEGTVIYPSASIGTKTQALKYRGEKTFVQIGKNCEIREFVTINSSFEENSTVKVGDNCLIMAYCHIAHHCEVGNRVIMSNNVNLAGHVTLEDCAIIGGMSAIHQFSRVGRYAMVGGLSGISRDIPPYSLGAGNPYKMGGLNIIGLKRNGVSLKTRKELSKAFKLTYRSGLRLEEALERISKEVEPLPEVQHWISFCRSSKRGLICQSSTVSDDEMDQIEKEEEKAYTAIQ
ncbi:MAG: acyl-ACP--UDP-N-acetylglucosamine O-acyltransferase [Parachlamydia sp.]|nr:acyl-ACP--UDP-N-acetylglucosamine O-acyltransferase [Parachlamydia sp.]